MNIEELIQLMRTCSLAKVRAELENLKHKQGQGARKAGDIYYTVVEFYQRVSERK